MRQTMRAIVVVCGIAVAQPASAQSVLHEWPMTGTTEAGTILTAQGSAAGRGLTATIADAVPMSGREAVTVFDAEIERQMEGSTIIERNDSLRVSMPALSMLVTTIVHESGWLADQRIAVFAATSKGGKSALRVIRADGPLDRKLMDHYSGDVLAIAQYPEEAIAGNLTLEAHSTARKVATPTEETAPNPAKTSQKTALSSELSSAPTGWSRKVYTDAASYWPTSGPLARGSKTGYLEIMVYTPDAIERALGCQCIG